MAPTEVTGGFFISSPAATSAVASGKDQEIYVMSARRSNMKDRINKGTWTIALSGSVTVGTGTGADGATLLQREATDKNYGFFYPNLGILVFSAAELSSSIPGKAVNAMDTVEFDNAAHTGFGYATASNDTANP